MPRLPVLHAVAVYCPVGGKHSLCPAPTKTCILGLNRSDFCLVAGFAFSLPLFSPSALTLLARVNVITTDASWVFAPKRLAYSSTASDHKQTGKEQDKEHYNTVFEVTITAKDRASSVAFCVEAPDDVSVLSEARSITSVPQLLSMGVHSLRRSRTTDCWTVDRMEKDQSLVLQYDGVRISLDPKVPKPPIPSSLAVKISKESASIENPSEQTVATFGGMFTTVADWVFPISSLLPINASLWTPGTPFSFEPSISEGAVYFADFEKR